MRATQLIREMVNLNSVLRTVCIEGPPGGGKTTIVRQVAVQADKHYIERHLPTMPVEDFGAPDMLSKEMFFGYKMPEWFPYKGSPIDDGRGGILLFDDRNQAGADLQKVLANICQARNLHGVELADGWQIVSTGNRQADRAGANRVLSHLRDRETVLDLETNLDDWTTWAIDNGVNPSLISFIRFRPGLLHDFDPQRENNPTPRSWVEGVSDIIDVVSPDAEFECFKGAVGEGPAAEYVGFRKIERQLPNIDQLLMNPDTTPVPEEPATLYAISGAIAHKATNANFARVITFCNRMPPEFGVLAVSYATRKNNELASTQAFTDWAVANQDVLF